MKFVLASKSQGRREVLSTFIKDFEIIDSEYDESIVFNKNTKYVMSPAKLVRSLSKSKCRAVFDRLSDERCVIGADTVVTIDHEIIGKPKDEDDAKRVLRLLSGRVHKVLTGVCIKILKDDVVSEFSFVNSSSVHFKNISDEEIDEYIKTGEPMGKAGCYAIQGKAGKFIDKINGSLHSIVGLPIAQVYEVLRDEGLV